MLSFCMMKAFDVVFEDGTGIINDNIGNSHYVLSTYRVM